MVGGHAMWKEEATAHLTPEAGHRRPACPPGSPGRGAAHSPPPQPLLRRSLAWRPVQRSQSWQGPSLPAGRVGAVGCPGPVEFASPGCTAADAHTPGAMYRGAFVAHRVHSPLFCHIEGRGEGSNAVWNLRQQGWCRVRIPAVGPCTSALNLRDGGQTAEPQARPRGAFTQAVGRGRGPGEHPCA